MLKQGHYRIFYFVAVCACGLLLLPYPGTVFLAVCFSCLTIPLYRRFKSISLRKERRLNKKKRLARSLWRRFPLTAYTFTLFSSILIPLSILVLLVAPQASRGLTQLRDMQLGEKINVLMPDNLKIFINTSLPSLKDYPALSNIIDEFTGTISSQIYSFLGDIFSPLALWNRSVSLLGGGMTMLWICFLFFILTILFTLYARNARVITARILGLPNKTIKHFMRVVQKALNAIMLGIVVVALLQGLLCGIGFAVAGIDSPAFWGLMAAFVAPIPMIGTMLVWGPLAILLWLKGSHFAAVGLTLWGAIIVSGVDNICRPLFLQHGIKAPFFVLILTIICGMAVFGPIGLVAGPVLLAIAMALIEEAHRYYDRNL
ncbi:MAG: AI-2E family transporter [Desulfovibrio sp.]|nr:AI-2E family transporter [Desulfovibrio sp.]